MSGVCQSTNHIGNLLVLPFTSPLPVLFPLLPLTLFPSAPHSYNLSAGLSFPSSRSQDAAPVLLFCKLRNTPQILAIKNDAFISPGKIPHFPVPLEADSVISLLCMTFKI